MASLQENKKFAEDVTAELAKDNERDYADRKFTVKVPKTDNYYPILRYKCSPNLRPVPIVSISIVSNDDQTPVLTEIVVVFLKAGSNKSESR